MNHPALVKAATLIKAGDIVGAESALASLVDSDGDEALVALLDDFPAKDLLAVLRDFDSSRESVVSLLVTPEQFAEAVVLERRYGDSSHERLRGMVNAVVFRAGSDPDEFLAAIGASDGGCEALADYLCDRIENVEYFFRTGSFDFFADADEETAALTDDERLEALSHPESNRPFITHSEVNDHDWMELTWTLRYQHPEVFRDVLSILRVRARAEERQQAEEAGHGPARKDPQLPAGNEEESAL